MSAEPVVISDLEWFRKIEVPNDTGRTVEDLSNEELQGLALNTWTPEKTREAAKLMINFRHKQEWG